MKKFVFVLMAMIITSVNLMAQKPIEFSDTVYINKNWFKGSGSFHSVPNCPKLMESKQEVYAVELKSARLHYTLCDECFIKSENQIFRNELVYGTPIHSDNLNLSKQHPEDRTNQIYEAGKYLEKSAKLQWASLGISLGTTFITSLMSISDKDMDNAIIAFGLVGTLTSAALEIASIQFRLKSGRALKLSASHITYNF